jgi:hypothetical protein
MISTLNFIVFCCLEIYGDITFWKCQDLRVLVTEISIMHENVEILG